MPDDGQMERLPRRIVCVVFDGTQTLDVVGPLEVFHGAHRLLTQEPPERGRNEHRDPGYELRIVSIDGRPVRSDSGILLGTDDSIGQILDDPTPIDTLLVAGGVGVRSAVDRPDLVAGVGALAARSRRVAGICTGAFVLARAGLLDGHRAVTHWSSCDLLAELFPHITVEADPIFINDGRMWTSAGVTAGMDLALALVDDDVGPTIAHDVASWLVMFTRRPGGQSQFSAAMRVDWATRPTLRALQSWIGEHLDEDLSVAGLAARAQMSERHFARTFRAECGQTPGDYVEGLRLEAARQLLERSDLTVDVVAQRVGLSGAAVLHRMFRRQLGTTPASYRRHFAPAISR